MRKAIRLMSLILAASLAVGCGAQNLFSTENTATVETASDAEEQWLNYYASDSAEVLIDAFVDSQYGVRLVSDERDSAGLTLADAISADAKRYNMANDPLLAAAAERAGITDDTIEALPLGRSLYGYWVRTDYLTALFGENAVAALQTASWAEWSDCIETLAAWLEEPSEATVTLSGETYTLPAERPAELEKIDGIFAEPTDVASGYTAALLAAGEQYTAEALEGPINGVYYAAALEWNYRATSKNAALFRRERLSDLIADFGAEYAAEFSLIPYKCNLVDSDLSTEEYNLEGLLNYPVLASAGQLSMEENVGGDGFTSAKSFALWLYTSADGEDALTNDLGVITPWNTASDTTEIGKRQIEQVNKGILPCVALSDEVILALTENEATLQTDTDRTAAERQAFTQRVLEILGAAESAEK